MIVDELYAETAVHLTHGLRGAQVHHCSVVVVVGKPIETAKMTYDDRDALCDQVRKGLWDRERARKTEREG